MNFIKKYKLLSIFLTLIFIGIIGRLIFGDDSIFWSIWGVLDTSSAVALAVLAFLAYKDIIKEEDEIEIIFSIDGNLRSSGLKLLRKDCTRGEIIGVLGMMQKDTAKRFKMTPYELKNLLDEIKKVQKENKNTIIINMNKDEFEQFVVLK